MWVRNQKFKAGDYVKVHIILSLHRRYLIIKKTNKRIITKMKLALNDCLITLSVLVIFYLSIYYLSSNRIYKCVVLLERKKDQLIVELK
jgi:hypothetical protein